MSTLLTLNLIFVHACACDFCSRFSLIMMACLKKKREIEREFPSETYLPKSSGGLDLPSISSIFKKIRCGLAASQMCSRDSTVRFVASQQTVAEKSTRVAFKPHQEVIEVLKDDPGALNRQIIRSEELSHCC